jgi:NDP-sugar pyrophosphorylase family protein
MARIQHALIMAAGRGRRMMPFTQALPKPMAPYHDTTLIAHGISQIRKYIPNIHVTVGYKGAVLAQHLIEQGITSVFNTDGKSNSWWIHNTLLRHLDEPIFVLTCDNVMELDFGFLERDYFQCGAPSGMIVPVHPVKGLDGDYIFREGRYVTELKRDKKSDIYCSGIQVLNPARVSKTTKEGEDFYAIWNQLIAARQLFVSEVYPTHWFSVDTFADLQRTEIEAPPENRSGNA